MGNEKGYAKNPVAVRKFDEVATKLNSAGITELTPDNREKFEKITGEYIRDRYDKTGTKFGWYNRSQKVSNDYL